MVQPRDYRSWANIETQLLVHTISHPLEYAKFLIQIGHEPLPPKPTTTLFGYPALGLPNIFQYVRYIKSVDGFTGCFRGLVPKLCSCTVSAIVFEKTAKAIVFEDEPNKEVDEDTLSEEDTRKRCLYQLIREALSRAAAVIVSHPLEVIALRTMAQFVGGETKYNGLFRSIIEVYRENGIAGYYAGIVPRLVGCVTTLVLVTGSTYVINKYVIGDREIREHTAPIMAYLCDPLTYPFHVVSHCMVVNNCGLTAGRPPQMPIYINWLDCWSHLSSIHQLKRGSSVLWRYYTGPVNTSSNWKLFPANKSKFKRLE